MHASQTPQAFLTCNCLVMNHRETFNKHEGPSESTGPPALPQRVTGTAALGPGVRRGHGGVCPDLSQLCGCSKLSQCLSSANYMMCLGTFVIFAA